MLGGCRPTCISPDLFTSLHLSCMVCNCSSHTDSDVLNWFPADDAISPPPAVQHRRRAAASMLPPESPLRRSVTAAGGAAAAAPASSALELPHLQLPSGLQQWDSLLRRATEVCGVHQVRLLWMVIHTGPDSCPSLLSRTTSFAAHTRSGTAPAEL